MKRLSLFLGVLALSLSLVACGSTEPTSQDVDTPTDSSDQDVAEQTDNEFETKVGEVVKNDMAENLLVARNSQIEPIVTGPITLKIPQVNTISAKFKGEAIDLIGSDEAEYIQVDMEVENSSEDTITFYASQAVITTSTGEQLDNPHMLLSEHINGDFIGAVKKSGTSYYFLEKSKAEDIEWIRILISSPQDSNFESIGEDIDIKVEF